MSMKEQLIAAKQLILDRSNWHQEEFAADEHGGEVGTMQNEAKCFCALGAAARTMSVNVDSSNPDRIPHDLVMILDRAADRFYTEKTGEKGQMVSIVELNDGQVIITVDGVDMHPHDAVLAAYDVAIEMADETKGTA